MVDPNESGRHIKKRIKKKHITLNKENERSTNTEWTMMILDGMIINKTQMFCGMPQTLPVSCKRNMIDNKGYYFD